MEYSDEEYNAMIDRLFVRFPSFQNVGGQAYKPGLDNMIFFDQLSGHPHRKYVTVHIAGTNGKGSVSNMLASVFAASGLKTGLYTSPHILDFRERMRILDGKTGKQAVEYIPKEKVMEFVGRWQATFDHLDMSFFEITTMMAFHWFASEGVDVAVIETGLGGRLDSTNIISPAMDIITNIGLDHCDMLGNTLGEIAFEKAGIIKPRTPVVVGESSPDTGAVFERKVLYTNLPDPEYMGDRNRIMSLLTFADKVEPSLWRIKDELLREMANDDDSYRSLVGSWFDHSPLLELIKNLVGRKAIVIVTSDHGSIRITNPVRIKGDRETSVNLRYKVGRNLEFNPKEVFSIRNPGEIFLPKVNITSSFVFCRQNDFFVYPNNFNQYVAYYRNTIQHGGKS